MKIKRYTPKEFYERYQKELLSKEAVYQLIITNCQKAIENPQADCLIGTVEDDQKTYLFFQYTRPYRMLIHALDDVDAKMIETLIDYLKAENIEISGINTSKEIADLYLKIADIKEYQIRTKMDVMELKKGDLIEQISTGSLIYATLDDLDFALDNYRGFYKDCFHEDTDINEYRPVMCRHIENEELFFYKVGDQLVAMCAITRKLVRGVSVGLVYTLPKYRGKGYAKQMMSELSKVIFAQEFEFACLYVDQNNPASNKAYKSIGYKIIEDKQDIVFAI
ncbi:GNAT family N-acetyltransferase [Beduini massiliensis]|uniref:GNAT family N-acetyltransferase n=1 Tax=Beduini massiliensis TaxID=1585974 RepID=UPI00059A93C0|nr:GNAT family N-acetyltransferase [Beduini massiliensis]